MSTSNANITLQKKERNFYAAATLMSLVTGTVYECFSHQVYSPFMYLLFLIPLLLGLVPNGIGHRYKRFFLTSADARVSYRLGVLTLICGSFLKGVFDIYGTQSVYPTVYLPVGILLLLVALGFERYQRQATSS